jgi:hypothetical protein
MGAFDASPNGSGCVCQEVRNSPSFQTSIDHGHHVVELHASRSAETGTFVTFIYEKDSERLLRHITGTDENEVIRQALAWCGQNS